MTHNLPSVTSPPWSLTTKRIVAVIVLIAAFLLARGIASATWGAIAVAVVLAYLLSPVVTFFERRLSIIHNFEIRRALAVVLTWLAVLGMFAIAIGLVLPAMASQLREFADELPNLVEDAEADLRRLLDRPITIGDAQFVPWDELQGAFSPDENGAPDSSLTSTLQETVLSLADPALGLVGGVVTFVVNLFFVLIMLFYLMRDGPLFVEYMVRVMPESYQGDARRLLHELRLVWNAYLRGQLVLCFAVGTATYIVALILGLPQPLLLAMVAGFLEFIPNIGPALAQIPALLFALTTSSSTIPGLDAGLPYAIVVSLSYILIQNLEAIFLVPRILGQSLDLHPFVVLVGLLVGAGLAGALGIVLAAPTIATLRVFLRYVRGKLLDEDAFASPAALGQGRGLVYSVLRCFLSKRFPVLPADYTVPTEALRTDDSPPPAPEYPDVSGWMSG